MAWMALAISVETTSIDGFCALEKEALLSQNEA